MKKSKKTLIVSVIIISILLISSLGFFFFSINKNNSISNLSMTKISTQSSISAISSNCRVLPDGSDFCCDNPDYVLCGDTNVCGSSQEWCDNFLNNVASCNEDKSICCNNVGNVYDYGAKICCSASYPFYIGDYNGNHLCERFSNSHSNNYYTHLSNCYTWKFNNVCGGCGDVNNPNRDAVGCQLASSCNGLTGTAFIQTDCNNQDYLVCNEDLPLIFNFQNKGKTIGKCGVQCLTDSDCGVGNECNLNKCEKLLNITVFRFEDNKCKEMIILSNQRTDNDYNILDDCKKNIKSELIKTIIIIVSILVIVLFTIFIIYFIIKKIKKKK